MVMGVEWMEVHGLTLTRPEGDRSEAWDRWAQWALPPLAH